MSRAVKTHMTCPECGHGECYTMFADGGFYCHSCGHKPDGYDVPDDTPDLFVEKYEARRGYHKEDAEFYGITVGYDKDGPQRVSYPYPNKTKYRYLPKDFSRNPGFKPYELFGIDKFIPGTSKSITIVEGEEDAPSAYKMLGRTEHVVALPGAGVSGKLIQNMTAQLNKYDEIIVCADADEAGSKVANIFATAFPNRVFIVDLSTSGYKDPNEMLQAGKETEFRILWTKRKKHTPTGFLNTPDQFLEVLDEQETSDFFPTPSMSLNDIICGLPKGHLTVITGPEGQGKTEILRWLEYYLLNTTDCVIGILHMEETKKTSLESFACYALEENLRDPDHEVAPERVENAIVNLTKDHKLFMFDFHIDEDPLSILEKVRYLSTACECDFIFIDPIQQLAYGKDMDDTEEKILSRIAVQLERLANDLNVGIVMTTHVNDDGQTRSSRMIGKSASVRIDLSRDHMNPDPDIRNTTHLHVSKNRPSGRPCGYAGSLIFNPTTFTISEGP